MIFNCILVRRSQTNILVVEDESNIAADLTDRLHALGYTVVASVDSGEEGLQVARATLPHLILMDVQLAGKLDGIHAAMHIREAHADVPLIFLTSNSDDATYGRTREASPKAFLSKPFRGRGLVPFNRSAI